VLEDWRFSMRGWLGFVVLDPVFKGFFFFPAVEVADFSSGL